MPKRIAYIGLSSPVLYDYEFPIQNTRGDYSPNPILEGPFGLMLLYDELWFLSKELCPKNMRRLRYVKFINEIHPSINYLSFLESSRKLLHDPLEPRVKIPGFRKIVKELRVKRKALDNHSRVFRIGNAETSAHPNSSDLLFDYFVCDLLSGHDDYVIELVTNSFTNPLLQGELNTPSRLALFQLTEAITLNGIANYYTPDGPYHECIEQARDDRYLVNFCKWIIEEHAHVAESEVNDVAREVENVIRQASVDLFDKHFDNSTRYISIAETWVGNIFPPAGIALGIKDVYDQAKEIKNSVDNRWQGFVVHAKNKHFRSF